MATYAKLRNAVAAYMHRDPSAFIIDGDDMLLLATNEAKNFCQRAADFEKAKRFGQILNVSLSVGANINTMQPFGGGSTIIPKSIERVFLDTGDGNTQFPVDLLSRDRYVEKLKRSYEDAVSRADTTLLPPFTACFPPSAMQYGDTIYPVPADTKVMGGSTINMYFDIVEWLPDFATTPVTGTATSTVTSQLVDSGATFVTAGVAIGDTVRNTTDGTSGLVLAVNSQTTLTLNADFVASGEAYQVDVVDGTQTNFLLDFAFDFMKFRSIVELNFFLKEDERVAISDNVLERIWTNVLKWNATIIGNSVDDATLD